MTEYESATEISVSSASTEATGGFSHHLSKRSFSRILFGSSETGGKKQNQPQSTSQCFSSADQLICNSSYLLPGGGGGLERKDCPRGSTEADASAGVAALLRGRLGGAKAAGREAPPG